jgi:Zn-dependent peptidase ImmA (M78 family)/transcriptional regulator with XRE-family HTH domain
MLTMARESRKMSQTALAEAAGISQSALSQMEAGVFVPGEDVAARLAAKLDYPVSIFSVAHRFQQLPLTFFRKQSKVSVRDVNAIRARVNLSRLRIEVLLKSGELRDPRVTLTNLRKEGLSPEQAAQKLRVYWNVPPGPIQNLTALVEAAGILVVPLPFGTAQVDGLSVYEPNDSVPPMIFLNPTMPPDRWRMTLAHELGHVVLHHHMQIPPDPKAMEAQSFHFATEFLMPSREIAGNLGNLNMFRLGSLKRHWRVSMRALLRHAHRLGKISERKARWLWIQLSRDGQAEVVEIAPEQPTAVKALVDRHLGELGYSQRDLCRALHQNPDEFRSDFGVAATHLRLA